MNRPLVAVSLRIFAQRACPEQRKAVWTRAFKRWHDWNFDKGVQEAHLLDIQYSELDFAVVSYAVEGLSAAERDSAITSIRGQLEQVEFAWHLTETDCITAWNRLLSVFQPYAHAMMVTSQGEDALATTRIYWPFDMSKSLYHHIMFRVNPASFGSGMRCDRSQQPTQDLS
jgi:hypothetical protein